MHGRVVEAACFDESGQPTLHKDGYAIIRKTYDTRGRLIEETLFDPRANQPATTTDMSNASLPTTTEDTG